MSSNPVPEVVRYILESSVAAISIQAIGKPGGLADVEIVEPVAVDIASGHAVVAVDVYTARAIQKGAPMIHSRQKL